LEDLATRIKSSRLKAKLSQEQVAEKAGLSQAVVSQLESGARNPSVQTLEKLADALDVSFEALAGRESMEDMLSDRKILKVAEYMSEMDADKKDHLLEFAEFLVKKNKKEY